MSTIRGAPVDRDYYDRMWALRRLDPVEARRLDPVEAQIEELKAVLIAHKEELRRIIYRLRVLERGI